MLAQPTEAQILGIIADVSLTQKVELLDGTKAPAQFLLYDCLRREQSLVVGPQPAVRSEAARILDLAQAAYRDLVGLLAGRDDALLEQARDGDWSLRDLLRHAIAVELRYAAQVDWGATRRDEDPVPIPDERLSCDRLSPPEPEFADARSAGMARVLELLGTARARSDLLDALPNDALGKPTLWAKLPMTVRMRVHQMAAHLTEVVIQAEKCLARYGPDTDARRIVRRCAAMRGAHERWSEGAARAEIDADYRRIADASTR